MWLLTGEPFPYDIGGFLAGAGAGAARHLSQPLSCPLQHLQVGQRTRLVTWSPNWLSVVYTQTRLAAEPACCLCFWSFFSCL